MNTEKLLTKNNIKASVVTEWIKDGRRPFGSSEKVLVKSKSAFKNEPRKSLTTHCNEKGTIIAAAGYHYNTSECRDTRYFVAFKGGRVVGYNARHLKSLSK